MRSVEERNVLSLLGIDDFRHMNKDSVIKLIQMMLLASGENNVKY